MICLCFPRMLWWVKNGNQTLKLRDFDDFDISVVIATAPVFLLVIGVDRAAEGVDRFHGFVAEDVVYLSVRSLGQRKVRNGSVTVLQRRQKAVLEALMLQILMTEWSGDE